MKSIPRIFPFLRSYRWSFVLLFFSVVIPVAMELMVPKALSYIIDQGVTPGDMQAIWRRTGLMLGAALLGTFASQDHHTTTTRFTNEGALVATFTGVTRWGAFYSSRPECADWLEDVNIYNQMANELADPCIQGYTP